MPDATITSTASTFGTITGTFAADQSTVTGTITGIITGTLSGSVGVPGQQGPTGPQGPQGVPGEGVPVGGTAGQFLTKIDGTNYNTDWTTLNLSAYLTKAGNLEGLTNLSTARDNIGLGQSDVAVFSSLQTASDIIVGVDVPGSGIIFGDSTQQNTAFPGFAGYATESWVTTGFAPKASPAFTGNPTAPTPTLSDNDTSIATTAFVKGQGYLTSASLSGYATESWVTAGFAPIAAGLPSNGAEGQILVKQSATSYDAEWQDNFATELRMPARNETGSTLTKGTVVYISGGAGNKPLLSKALATSDATSAQTMGIVTADISNNQNGDVTIRGQLKGLNTSAFAVGTQLYLSGTTAGTYTSTKPSAPTHLVYVGIVVRSNSTEGAIEVAVQNGYELDELHDVALSSEANNDLLAYESSTNLWKNKTFSALGLLTSSAAASTYYPLSGNPSGFLTSSSLTGYATESWVTTALGSYLTTSAASSTYLSKADNLASVASTSTARSNLGLGSLDTPTFAGVNVPGSGTSVANLGATSLTINQQGSGQFTIQPSQGIVFPDASIQTTAVNATVLGDYLTKAGNLSGLANTSTARTNLGLGTLATVNDAPSDGSQYARKNGAWDVVTGGSSYITSVSSPLAVSSGNLTVDLSAKADLASPALSGVPTAPTATLGTNTTQIATTAFVLANGGSPTFATAAETLGASITNEVLSPASIPYIMGLPGYRSMNGANVSNGVNGGALITRGWVRVPYVLTSANARITASSSTYGNDNAHNSLGSKDDPFKIDFSKKCAIWGLFENGAEQGVGGDLRGSINNTFRVNLGGRSAYASGNLTQKGIGIYMQGGGSSDVYLTVHDGTTLTSVASGFAPARQTVTHYFVYSDGAGNVYLYLNGEYKCQTSLGPTGTTTKNYCVYEEQIESGGTGSSYTACMAGTGVYIQQ
jgi:hypothetical protein